MASAFEDPVFSRVEDCREDGKCFSCREYNEDGEDMMQSTQMQITQSGISISVTSSGITTTRSGITSSGAFSRYARQRVAHWVSGL